MVFGPPVFTGGDTPGFDHAFSTFSNHTDFRASGRFGLSSVYRARRVADEKEDRFTEEEDKIAGKPKSADDYFGWPNNGIKTLTQETTGCCRETL